MKKPGVLWIYAGGVLLLLIALYSVRVLRYYPETRLELGRTRLIRLDDKTCQRLRNLESSGHILLILLVIPLVALAIDRLLFWVQRQLFPHRYGGPGSPRSPSWTRRPGPPGSSSPTSSCRWPSARRARTPAWPPG